MTINEAISIVDESKPNQVSMEMKKKWLNDLDGRIYAELISTHEDSPVEGFTGYDMADGDTDLLVPSPYDEIYRWYMEMQMDLMYREMDKYLNSMTLYNTAWQTYARAYNRKHKPLSYGLYHKF